MLSDFFQKKSLLTLSIFLLVELGGWKHCIMCVGIVSKLVWINATLPVLVIFLASHVWSLAVVLLTNSENVFIFGLSLKIGHPKYLPRLSWCFILSTEDTIHRSCAVAFLDKGMDDFLKFMSCPDLRQKWVSRALSFWHGSKFVLQKKRLSSANRRHGSFSALGAILKPIPLFFLFCSSRNARVRTSINIKKRYGDDGSPWRNPLDDVKNPDTSSLIITEWDIVVTQCQIQLIQVLWNPSCFTSSRKLHSTRSYTFSMSSFNTTHDFFPFMELNLLLISWVSWMLSWMDRCATKALWTGSISLSSTGRIWLTKILAIIL